MRKCTAFTFTVRTPVLLLALMTACAGGKSADSSMSESQSTVKSAAFVGPNNAWLVTEKQGNLMATKDGGANWKTLPGQLVENTFESVSFIDGNVGFASNTQGKIWRTTDGGNLWTASAELSVPGVNQWKFMSSRQMHFTDGLHGWLTETFTIWRTLDGGSNWKPVFSVLDPVAKGQPERGFFLNGDVAWVINSKGGLYKTSDGGNHWDLIAIEKNISVADVFFINERIGWFAAFESRPPYAKIYRTTDGGKNWLGARIPDDQAVIQSISFADELEGWCVGRVWNGDPASSRAVVFHTINGGQNWITMEVDAHERFFDRIHFGDSQHGWLFGQDHVYRTEDRGKTWRIVLKLPAI
jgi:photosystem II stability/assembly factor-like uncharacterized protein